MVMSGKPRYAPRQPKITFLEHSENQKSVRWVHENIKSKQMTWMTLYLWCIAEVTHCFSNILDDSYIVLPAVVPKLR